MSRDKLERIDDFIESLQKEIDQPIWADDQKDGFVDAQSALSDVKESVQRTDFQYGVFSNVDPHVENSDKEPDSI